MNLNFYISYKDNNGLVYKNDKYFIIEVNNIYIYEYLWKNIYDFFIETIEIFKLKYNNINHNILIFLKDTINIIYNKFNAKGDTNKRFTNNNIEYINKIFIEKKKILNKFLIL